MIKLREYRLIFHQLSQPFSYLRIRHDSKWVYDWFVPAIFTALTILFVYFFSSLRSVYSEGGLLPSLKSFLEILPGFFIAALAAVATFNKNDIDEFMDDDTQISVFFEGHVQLVNMTRRRFLCVLFSYLTASSVFLVIASSFLLSFDPSILGMESYVQWFIFVIFFLVFWQLIVATMFGLYYLGERLHTPQK